MSTRIERERQIVLDKALVRDMREMHYPHVIPREMTAGRRRLFQSFRTNILANERSMLRFINPPRGVNINRLGAALGHGGHTADGNSGQYIFRIDTDELGEVVITGEEFIEIFSDFRKLIARMLKHVKIVANLLPNSKLQISIDSPGERNNVNLQTPFMSHLSAAQATGILKAGIQSATSIDLNRSMFTISYSRGKSGGAYFKLAKDVEEFISKKRCVVRIQTRVNRNDCFYQCVALGFAQNTNLARYKVLAHKKSQKERELQAEGVCINVGLHRPVDAITLDAISKYEDKYRMGICVINYVTLGTIHTANRNYDYRMFMLYTESDEGVGHFHYVNKDKPHALFNKRRFCHRCSKAYQDASHKCFAACIACGSETCASVNKYNPQCECPGCHRMFFDLACMRNHKKCKSEKRCPKCAIQYRVGRNISAHVCGSGTCKNCDELYPLDEIHECFIQELKPEDVKEPSLNYIFYDYECMFDGLTHVVVHVVAMYMTSDECFTFDDNDSFVDWLFKKEHKGFTCIAHNGGRYDIHFIKSCMLKRGIKSNDICVGNTITHCEAYDWGLRFIDSRNFIPLALREFSNTFGIADTFKGYFPYTFLTPDTKDYVGKIPDIKFFEFKNLKPKDHAVALVWYDEHKDDDINLMEMCSEYCKDDVLLLKQGCIKFRQLFLDITKGEIDPFQYITIASVCMKIYTRFHLPRKTIAIFNKLGSVKYQEEWGTYLKELRPDFRPRSFGGTEGNTVFLYRKCIDFGCPSCFMKHSLHPITGIKMMDLHAVRHLNNVQRLRSHGKIVIHIFECQWLEQRKRDDIMSMFDSLADTSNELEIRDAFFGGRTEPLKLYKKVSGNEKIRYIDYTSLYPSIQYGCLRGLTEETYDDVRECPYPVGHPVYIKEEFKDISEYFGFATVTITPPRNLYHPVLCEKKDGKLVFDLLPKTGTWATIEIMKAIEMGYTLNSIIEVCHFEEQNSELFKGYVSTFLKIKQEANGWDNLLGNKGPHTEEQKYEYIRQYKIHQDIQLDYSAIDTFNPGLYFIAKLCLNSLWGKFGQRNQFPKTVDTFDEDAFIDIVHSDKNEISNIIFHDCRTRTVIYKTIKEFAKPSVYTNIAIAAYTTAYARLRLYEALEILGRSVLYYDTDSVIYVDDGSSNILTGAYLGDMTDELKGKYITDFASTGPKSYAYITDDEKTTCKVKGFTLNMAASSIINFDSLKHMVCVDKSYKVYTQPMQFNIDRSHEIQTKTWSNEDNRPEGKAFRLTFDKRRSHEYDEEDQMIDTTPFGFY